MNALMQPKQQGFTLVEVIVSIVIMSIISIGMVTFITNSATSYATTAARNQVSASGRVVMDRIAMDLRNSVPESVRMSTPLGTTEEMNGEGYAGDQCIEFIPVLAATTYIDPAVRPAAHKFSFDVVDFVPTMVGRSAVYAIIYPTSPAQIYEANLNGTGTAPNYIATEAIARVDVTNSGLSNRDTLTYSRLVDDDPYKHRFRRESSVARLFLTEEPISYCITGSKLYRYSNYGFTPGAEPMRPLEPDGDCTAGLVSECLPGTTPSRVLITDQLDNSAVTQAFDQVDPSRQRNAVIQIELNFSQDGEEVRLNHEVLQQITP